MAVSHGVDGLGDLLVFKRLPGIFWQRGDEFFHALVFVCGNGEQDVVLLAVVSDLGLVPCAV